MNDPTAEYFTALAATGHYQLLRSTRGTVRFDLAGDGQRGEHWHVDINRGHITVTRGDEHADCVVRTDKTLFDGIVTGKVNTMAAMLRGQIDVEGDLHLVTMLQRLFPGRPDTPSHQARRTHK